MPDTDSYAPERAPPSAAHLDPRREGDPRRDSEPPPSDASDTSDTADPLDVAVLLSIDDADAMSSRLVPPELSPELAQILRSAEDRVSAFDRSHSSRPPPLEDDVDFLLPPDLLASLDEPIDAEDALSAATGRARTSGALTGMQSATGVGALSGAGTAVQVNSVGGGLGNPDAGSTKPVPSDAPPARASTGAPEVTHARRDLTTPGIAPQMPVSAARVSSPTVAQEATSLRNEALTGVDVTGPSHESLLTAPTGPGAEAARLDGAASVHESIVPLTMGDFARVTPTPPVAASASMSHADGALSKLLQSSPRESALSAPASLDPRLPAVLQEGDAVRVLAKMIASRASGALALGPPNAVRRIVLHDGDIVTTASSAADETLVAFLVTRGDLERDVASRLAGRLPASGRHAGAALVGHGHLGQEDLWPTLRAHAEWIIGQALRCDEGACELEEDVPARLRAEPNVFGGATGAEVLLEQIRRVIPPELAIARLGGRSAHIAEGAKAQLLGECALRPEEMALVRGAPGKTLGELLDGEEAELADVVYGLAALGVLEIVAPIRRAQAKPAGADPLDDEALRQRVRARMALVEEGDYFAVLGVPRSATGYEVRRAYLELRRAFEPGRVLTASTADLLADLRLVLEVLDEAYEILREPNRRDRYRRAIEAGPPSSDGQC